jgi:hypothetical protein
VGLIKKVREIGCFGDAGRIRAPFKRSDDDF